MASKDRAVDLVTLVPGYGRDCSGVTGHYTVPGGILCLGAWWGAVGALLPVLAQSSRGLSIVNLTPDAGVGSPFFVPSTQVLELYPKLQAATVYVGTI